MRINQIEISWPDILFKCEHENKKYELHRHGRSYELRNESGEVIKSDRVKREFVSYCSHLSTSAIENGLKH